MGIEFFVSGKDGKLQGLKMDILSLINYFRSLPPSKGYTFEPYTEEKTTFTIKKSPRLDDPMLLVIDIKLQGLELQRASNWDQSLLRHEKKSKYP